MFANDSPNRRIASEPCCTMPRLVLKTSRIAWALCAFFVVAILLSACGGSDSVPSNAVAVIDGKPITKAAYEHWASITARGSSTSGRAAVVPDPPNFTACIAQLRKTQKPAKGQPAPSDTTLRAQCKQMNTQLVQQTMSTLIQARWVEGEADKLGVSVSPAEARKQLDTTKKQSFPTKKAYEKFLNQSGMTEADVLERLRGQVLAQKIIKKIQEGANNVTDEQVAAYYNQHKSDFSIPERRDLEIILTKSEAQAKQAKAAIEGGMSWAAAAKKYSTDAASRATGGKLNGVAKGQQDRALDTAAFAAQKGKLVGPVKGQFGFYVVRVTGIKQPEQTSLADAKPQIKPLLIQQEGQKKMAAFVTDFQKRWKDQTTCRTGYVVELCKNAPKPQTTSTAGGTTPTPSTSGTSTSGK